MECKRCGRCCTELELEIVEIDLIREPRLRTIARPVNNPDEDKTYLLPSPCPFYNNNQCMIYPTRPNLCVSFGDECLLKKEEVFQKSNNKEEVS